MGDLPWQVETHNFDTTFGGRDLDGQMQLDLQNMDFDAARDDKDPRNPDQRFR